MKIMQFIPEFGLAGAETMCENLSSELVKLGHDVTVVSLYSTETPITERLRNKGIPLLFLNKKSGLDLGLFSRIRKLVKDYHPDILHTHLYSLKYVGIASLGLQVKGIVHTVHNIAEKESSPRDQKLNRLLFRNNIVTPVALSNLIQDTVQNVYNISPDKVPIVLNGVPKHLDQNNRTYEFSDKIRIIHVGRFSTAKNHLELLKAILKLHQENPKVSLHFFGTGELRSEIDKFIQENNAKEFLVNHGLTNDIPSELSKSDIFVLPSIYEGVPMSIIEAMMDGLPIVASAVGGIPDMIQDGKNGLLCRTDHESIYKTLQRVVENQELRKIIGTNAFSDSDTFSAERMAKNYITIYQNLCH